MGKHGKGGGAGSGAAGGGKRGPTAAAAASGGTSGASASTSGASASAGGGSFSLEVREGVVALLRFRSRDAMNTLLDPISNAMEGAIANRLGHNFPLSDSDRAHAALRRTCGLPKQVRYVIATLDGDAHSIRHEMCHARYYLQPDYRDLVAKVWGASLSEPQRSAITAFLNRLKYDTVAHVDEFQAYLSTEKPNFFGMDLTDAQGELLASFAPGSWR